MKIKKCKNSEICKEKFENKCLKDQKCCKIIVIMQGHKEMLHIAHLI